MTERRLLFGSVAEQYDAYRPGYPPQLLEAVFAYAGGDPASMRVLEVGAGTGKATRLFAPLVTHVSALEPDASMIAAAQAHPQAPLNVTHLQSDFEHAQGLESAGFDLIISATAWHWTDVETRCQRAAALLKPGGALAAFWNAPVWEHSPLREQIDAAYQQAGYGQDTHFGVMHPHNNFHRVDDEFWLEELKHSELTEPRIEHVEWTQPYTTAQYAGLLSTHSDHLMLPGEQRGRLLRLVAEAIDSNGGSFELAYRSRLCLARRREELAAPSF